MIPQFAEGPRSSGASSASRAGLPSRNSTSARLFIQGQRFPGFLPRQLLAFFSSGLTPFLQAMQIGRHQLGLDRISASAMGSILPSTWVMSIILKQRSTLNHRIDLADIGQELVAQAAAPLEAAAHQAGDIDAKVMRVEIAVSRPNRRSWPASPACVADGHSRSGRVERRTAEAAAGSLRRAGPGMSRASDERQRRWRRRC